MLNEIDKALMHSLVSVNFTQTEMKDLHYLLSLDENGIKEFHMTMPADDIVYASQLMERARYEVLNHYKLEASLNDLSDANEVINKIRNLK